MKLSYFVSFIEFLNADFTSAFGHNQLPQETFWKSYSIKADIFLVMGMTFYRTNLLQLQSEGQHVDLWFATKWNAKANVYFFLHCFIHWFTLFVLFMDTYAKAALALCRWRAMLRTGVHTFLSGGSRGLQLFARSWWSSSNLRLMFSMESWSMSQKPARSEATGRGWALGFCRVETR